MKYHFMAVWKIHTMKRISLKAFFLKLIQCILAKEPKFNEIAKSVT